MLRTLFAATLVIPISVGTAVAGGGGCNWSSKETAQTPVPASVASTTTQTPAPVDTPKLDMAQAPLPTQAPKSN